jgi:hypothetical protein
VSTRIYEDHTLQNSPPEPGCNLPRAIIGLMLYSDATHVAQFGQAKLWPIYVYFANQSKYERYQPSANDGHNVAFLPSVFLFVMISNHQSLTKCLTTSCLTR